MLVIVLNSFPLQSTAAEARAFLAQFGQSDMIIHASAREVAYTEHIGPLSIKCAFNGAEVYQLILFHCLIRQYNLLVRAPRTFPQR